MKFPWTFRRPWHQKPARGLYEQIVRHARQSVYFEEFAVPDTAEGRFDMIALHAILVMRRLKDKSAESAVLSQALFDLMFADMDENLREMGVGDLMVGKRIQKLAELFMGRIAAYEDSLNAPTLEELEGAVVRNLYRDGPHPGGAKALLAQHVRAEDDHLATQALDDLLAGKVEFLPAPAFTTQNSNVDQKDADQ